MNRPLKSGCEALAHGRQEQIAASHEIDGVRKEKERLTAASQDFFYSPSYGFSSSRWTGNERTIKRAQRNNGIVFNVR